MISSQYFIETYIKKTRKANFIEEYLFADKPFMFIKRNTCIIVMIDLY